MRGRFVERAEHAMYHARLSPAAREVLGNKLTYLTPARLWRIETAVRQVERRRVPGDIVEFGVALGGSAIVLAQHAGPGRRFHGFDVFSMIPPPTSEKDDDNSRDRYRAIASGQSLGIGGEQYYGYRQDLFDVVVESFARRGLSVDGEVIQLHRGLFHETWPDQMIPSVALAHIDGDWHDSVSYCLWAVADRLASGGAVVVDDYHDWGGAKIAVDEFLAARSDFSFHQGPNPILRKR